LASLKNEIDYRFELSRDYADFRWVARRDKRFFPVFKKWMGMRNCCPQSLYELIVIATVLQNATVRRSQQMLDALLARFGTKVNFAGETLWAYWRPEDLEAVSEHELRALKLGYRAKFIKRVSHDFATGVVDEQAIRGLTKTEAEKELLKLYGVGPETARILLFEAFHHYDTFHHIAPWQQKIYSRLFYGKASVAVRKIQRDILARYQNYAMLAVHYIWEDVFWRRRHERIEWLEKEIRL
jgi:3-methyladenine DNA glycosylase/8-oxoguanine DNA glycosylase